MTIIHPITAILCIFISGCTSCEKECEYLIIKSGTSEYLVQKTPSEECITITKIAFYKDHKPHVQPCSIAILSITDGKIIDRKKQPSLPKPTPEG